jgi:hypothetical protein
MVMILFAGSGNDYIEAGYGADKIYSGVEMIYKCWCRI